MRSNRTLTFGLLVLGVIVSTGGYSLHLLTAAAEAEQVSTEQALQSFAALRPIDVHVHVFKTDPAFHALLKRLNLTLLNILVTDDTLSYRKQLTTQVSDALVLMRSSNGHVALCTTFDPYKFNEPSFTADSIHQLDENFAQGAIAVKIWKNVGMEIRDRSGKFVMPDDRKFALIYKDIAQRGKTLIAHLAEPDVAWGPPDPSDPSWSYYQANPQWFLYNRPNFPTKKTILEARDHVLSSNPDLRVVGVHLGSMEKDLDGIAKHFDQYPNFAVDTAARIEYLMAAPPEKVRAFVIKYQDRILYGTDLDLVAGVDLQRALSDWQSTYVRDWRFFATGETFEQDGRRVRGLELPQPVLRKIFRANALNWIPGLRLRSRQNPKYE